MPRDPPELEDYHASLLDKLISDPAMLARVNASTSARCGPGASPSVCARLMVRDPGRTGSR